MKNNEQRLVVKYVEKMFIPLMIILTAICISEVFFFAIRINKIIGIDFDHLAFKDIKNILYMFSYIYLVIISLLTLIAIGRYKNKKTSGKVLCIFNYVFSIGVLIWGAMISTLDSLTQYINDDSGKLIVYYTVVMGVSALLVVKPLIYNISVYTTLTGMAITSFLYRGELYSFSYYSNLIVFMLTASAINVVVYQLHKKNSEINDTLADFSYHDQLTNLKNRRALFDEFGKVFSNNELFTFVLIDLDNLKKINDAHGHIMGDKAISIVASLLTTNFGDYVFRYGGDEFAIISKYTSRKIKEVISDINTQLLASFSLFPIQISAGLFECGTTTDITSIIHNADTALYNAKSQGKSSCEIYGEN